MSRYVAFITPENIEISYELAGIGSRFVAALLDHLIQAVTLFILWFLVSPILGISISAVLGGSAAYWIYAILLVITFLVLFGYHALFELLWAGRTPGKRAAGLRVVRDEGWPIDPYASIIRNIVRLVDFLPPIYGAGLLSIFFSSEYKRLGDYAAGTLVIKERAAGPLGARGQGPPSPLVTHFLTVVKTVDALTPEEFRAIRRFVERRHELAIPIQAHIAMRLAQPLLPKLNLADLFIPIQWHYADLLEAIERRYVEEHGVLTGLTGEDMRAEG